PACSYGPRSLGVVARSSLRQPTSSGPPTAAAAPSSGTFSQVRRDGTCGPSMTDPFVCPVHWVTVPVSLGTSLAPARTGVKRSERTSEAVGGRTQLHADASGRRGERVHRCVHGGIVEPRGGPGDAQHRHQLAGVAPDGGRQRTHAGDRLVDRTGVATGTRIGDVPQQVVPRRWPH